jgi:hypothetical protein
LNEANGFVRIGGCLCGKIRYEVTGPEDYPHVCSCPHCQRLSGGPMMSWVSFPVAGFKWTGPGGEPSWYYSWPDSRRGFCPNCGSQVCAQDDGADGICMTMSSLDNPGEFTPVAQSFKDDAVSWLPRVPNSATTASG